MKQNDNATEESLVNLPVRKATIQEKQLAIYEIQKEIQRLIILMNQLILSVIQESFSAESNR